MIMDAPLACAKSRGKSHIGLHTYLTDDFANEPKKAISNQLSAFSRLPIASDFFLAES